MEVKKVKKRIIEKMEKNTADDEEVDWNKVKWQEDVDNWAEESIGKGTFASKDDAIYFMALIGIEIANFIQIDKDWVDEKCLPINLQKFMQDEGGLILNGEKIECLLDEMTSGLWGLIRDAVASGIVELDYKDKLVPKLTLGNIGLNDLKSDQSDESDVMEE